jgi:hypothetical protein
MATFIVSIFVAIIVGAASAFAYVVFLADDSRSGRSRLSENTPGEGEA